MKKINIAIDGPAGAGKSTVAKLVAEKLKYVYIDTGAMYRALTWQALQDNINIHEETDLVACLNRLSISFMPEGNLQRVYVNQRDVTNEIRTREVTNQVSVVASHPEVRKMMVQFQQQMAANKGVVMDGRDIGTHVLPDAELKIYLSASIEERAKRRYLELKSMGREQALDEIQEEIMKRDQADMNREFAPLAKASDAIELDSTGLTIAEVVNSIINLVQQRLESSSEKEREY